MNRDIKLKLSNSEKIQEKLILMSTLSIIILVIGDVIFEFNNNDKPAKFFLLSVLFMASILCFTYTFNAFTTGNIVKKWSNHSLFDTIGIKLKNQFRISDQKSTALSIKLFGTFTLILSITWIILIIYKLQMGEYY